MSQTLQNQITYAKSMNGIVSLSDGAGTTISNGVIISNDISGNSITTNSFSTTDLILPRKSTPAVIAGLGSTIDLDLLIQNFYFDTPTRFFEIYDDTFSGMMQFDFPNNGIGMQPANLSIFPSTQFDIDCPNVTFTNSAVSFPTSTVSFNSNLPTSTLTPTTGNQLITKTYADTTYAVAGAYATLGGNNAFTGTNTFNTNLPTSTVASSSSGTQFITRNIGDARFGQLAVANTWSLTNTFSNGIIPRRSAGGGTDLQISNNAMQYRQATSVNNIGIGLSTLIGDSVLAGQIYNTGAKNIAIGNFALEKMDGGSSCIAIGFQSMQNVSQQRIYGSGVFPSRCIAIGETTLRSNLYGNDQIAIGHNALTNVSSGNSSICMGTNVGNGLSFQGECVLIGSGCAPSVVDNAITAIGAQALGGASGGFNSGVAIGFQSFYFNNNASANTGVGAMSGFANQSGQANTCLGCFSGRFNTANNFNSTTTIGYCSSAEADREFVIGGNGVQGDTQFLTLPQRHRIACNQSPTGVTINLTFRSNENVMITDATTTTINLPTPDASITFNIGAKYNIIRQSATSNNITINAPSGQTIGVSNSSGTFSTSSTYVMTRAENQVILLCINNTGTSWIVVNNNIKNISYDTSTTNGIFGTGTISSGGTNNLLIGSGGTLTNGVNNIVIGDKTGSAGYDTASDNIIIGNITLNSAVGTCNSNVIIGKNNGSGLIDSVENTFVGFNISPSQTNILYSTALGSNCVIPTSTSYSTAIGYGATVTASNQLMLGRATETVRVPGTLQVSSVSAIASTITVNNNIIHKKYYLSMVNPTVLTGSTPLTVSPPLYEYTQVNLASGIIRLPLSADVEIGTVLRFRRITTMSAAINLEIQTGSGQSILGRNSITTATNVAFLAASVTYGSVVFLSSNLWSVLD